MLIGCLLRSCSFVFPSTFQSISWLLELFPDTFSLSARCWVCWPQVAKPLWNRRVLPGPTRPGSVWNGITILHDGQRGRHCQEDTGRSVPFHLVLVGLVARVSFAIPTSPTTGGRPRLQRWFHPCRYPSLTPPAPHARSQFHATLLSSPKLLSVLDRLPRACRLSGMHS